MGEGGTRYVGAGVSETHFSNFDYIYIYFFLINKLKKFGDLRSSFPNQGSNPRPREWGRGVLVTGLLGKFYSLTFEPCE